MSTKDRLLERLKAARGSWISGNHLSDKLGVSRAAVNKHIRTLKAQGYVIESATRKGYRFKKAPDRLLAEEIRQGLDTRVFGQKEIVCFEQTDSTNQQAKVLAAQGAAEGTLVIAEAQCAGRGRRGRRWYSPPGSGIYVSVVLRPAISPTEAPAITLMTAVAVTQALLDLTHLPVRIKWPNDILLNGKKIAGILTEISTEMDRIDYIVVGLGLNVNTPPQSFPQELQETAGSIRTETGKPFSRLALLRAILISYENCYDTFKTYGFDSILSRWKELSDIIGQRVAVDVMGTTHTGQVADVDADGTLVLKTEQGLLQRIFSGDVRLL